MAADGSERHTAQVVGADGEMDGSALERFAAAAGLVQRGLSYAVVSIFGPQGSGESTIAAVQRYSAACVGICEERMQLSLRGFMVMRKWRAIN